MHPPFGLHSPHSDNTPEGKATGQPASGWPVPQVFLQPLSGTREPGGGDGGRMGLDVPPVRWSWAAHTRAVTSSPHVRSTQTWLRVEARAFLAERGLHLLSSQVLVKL